MMNKSSVKMTNELYINTSIKRLNQISNKDMYVGVLGVKEIIQIVKFTQRENIEYDPFDSTAIDQKKLTEERYYQRIKDSDRTYVIKLFLLKQIYNAYTFDKKLISPLAIFPSSC